MTSETARARRSVSRSLSRSLSLSLGVLALGGAGCASFVEIPVETPLQSKLDVSAFRRVMVAGFVTEPGAQEDVDIATETARLLQNQLRSGTRLQVLEPDRPPLNDA